jgi:hypothetical protein
MGHPDPGGAGAPSAGRSDRPLGRGLADVSHVFLSHEGDPTGNDPGSGRRAARPLPRQESATSPLLLRPTGHGTRDQLAAALKEYAGALEDGLKVIDVEVPCPPYGEIDLLAVDRANQLTIIDFDSTASDDILIRALSHWDWMMGNVPTLRRMFRGLAINFSLQPRVFLIAPQFSTRMRRAAHPMAQLPIDWVRYHLVEAPGQPAIFFEHLSAD